MTDKNSILSYLKTKDLAVLSTASATGKPESAVMAITVKDDFTILMNSEQNTRKCGNIMSNGQASLIVGGLASDPSVQLDGTIKILDNQAAAVAREFMLTIHPELKDYFSETGKFIAFTPTWLRWSDYSQNPPEIIEIQL